MIITVPNILVYEEIVLKYEKNMIWLHMVAETLYIYNHIHILYLMRIMFDTLYWYFFTETSCIPDISRYYQTHRGVLFHIVPLNHPFVFRMFHQPYICSSGLPMTSPGNLPSLGLQRATDLAGHSRLGPWSYGSRNKTNPRSSMVLVYLPSKLGHLWGKGR